MFEEISAVEDPLSWWEAHENSLPIPAYVAERYMCMAASSRTSERVFSTNCQSQAYKADRGECGHACILDQEAKTGKGPV